MSFTMVLNSNNVVPNSNNSQFRYNFINGSFRVDEGSQMCISSIIMPYSFFNISQAYGNNVFSFTFPQTAGSIVYNVVVSDGFYTVSDLNNFLQNYCITNSLYLINSTGQYVYYLVFTQNVGAYANEILFYPVPTALPSGYTTPVSFPGFPAISVSPSLIIPTGTNTIGTFLGLSAGTYGGTGTASSVLSNITPVGSTVNGIIVRSNIVNNFVAMPSDIITSIPINSTFGSNITFEPTFEQWVSINAGVYNNLTIFFTDQNFNSIFARDSNVIITLQIRK